MQVEICTAAGTPPRVVHSRPLPCSAQRAFGFGRSGPRHFRSGMRTPPRDCYRGERARTRLCSPRLFCGVPRPIPSRCTYRGKKSRLRECGAVREVSMHNLVEFGMGKPSFPATDHRHPSDGWAIQRIAKGVAADHSRRAHDYMTFLASRRNIHESSRCSSQST
jgi:hypothetical protein